MATFLFVKKDVSMKKKISYCERIVKKKDEERKEERRDKSRKTSLS